MKTFEHAFNSSQNPTEVAIKFSLLASRDILSRSSTLLSFQLDKYTIMSKEALTCENCGKPSYFWGLFIFARNT